MPSFRLQYIQGELLYGDKSPVGRIHGSGNQEVQTGVTPLAITHSDPMGDFRLSVPAALSFAELEVLILKEGVLLSGNTARIL